MSRSPDRRPSRRLDGHTVLFLVVVILCVAQVAWWTFFQVRESARMEESTMHLRNPEERAQVLAQAAKRRRMFLWEGSTLTVLVIAGITLLAGSLRREIRMRQAQERFLTGATHELKTPLATLRLGLQSLALGKVDAEKSRRYLDAMLVQVQKLEEKVGDLLVAASVGGNGRKLHAEEGDLKDAVETVIQEMEPRFTEAGIKVVAGLESVPCRFDLEGVCLVTRNLLDNAVKYSDRGSSVMVSLRREGKEAVLQVADQGIGIPAEELPRLFDRFYRSSSREAVCRGGAGIGLYLVKEIVAAHGGAVECESGGEGKGARFFVRLPAVGGAGA